MNNAFRFVTPGLLASTMALSGCIAVQAGKNLQPSFTSQHPNTAEVVMGDFRYFNQVSSTPEPDHTMVEVRTDAFRVQHGKSLRDFLPISIDGASGVMSVIVSNESLTDLVFYMAGPAGHFTPVEQTGTEPGTDYLIKMTFAGTKQMPGPVLMVTLNGTGNGTEVAFDLMRSSLSSAGRKVVPAGSALVLTYREPLSHDDFVLFVRPRPNAENPGTFPTEMLQEIRKR